MKVQTVILIACVSKKNTVASKARDLYQSQWFIKARAYAELYGNRFYILSALWGLVESEQLIEPYNHTLKNLSKKERQEWAAKTAEAIHSKIPVESRIIILAGRAYRDGLVSRLEELGYVVEVPMRGLGIGQQLKFLKDAIGKKEDLC